MDGSCCQLPLSSLANLIDSACVDVPATLSLNDNNFAGATIPIEIASSATLSKSITLFRHRGAEIHGFNFLLIVAPVLSTGALNLSRTGIAGSIPAEFSSAASLGTLELNVLRKGLIGCYGVKTWSSHMFQIAFAISIQRSFGFPEILWSVLSLRRLEILRRSGFCF